MALGAFVALASIGLYSFWSLKRGRTKLLQPINAFWLGYLLFYVLHVIAYDFFWAQTFPPAIRVAASVLIAGAPGIVILGYESGIGLSVCRRFPKPWRMITPTGMAYFAVFALLVGLATKGAIYSVYGGAKVYFSVSRGARGSEFTGYSQMLESFLGLGVLAILVLGGHRRSRMWTAIGLTLGGMLLLFNAYRGARSAVIGNFVALTGGYYIPRRKKPGVWPLFALLVACSVSVAFLSYHRGQLYGFRFHGEANVRTFVESAKAFYFGRAAHRDRSPGANNADVFLSVVQTVPDKVPYDKGYMWLEYFTRVIPSHWWPNKIYPYSKSWDKVWRATELASWENEAGYVSGPAPGFLGYWYYILGPYGVFFGAFGTGVFLSVLTNVFDGAGRHIGDSFLYVTVLRMGFGLSNNPGGWVFVYLPSIALPFLLLLVISALGKRPGHAVGKAYERP